MLAGEYLFVAKATNESWNMRANYRILGKVLQAWIDMKFGWGDGLLRLVKLLPQHIEGFGEH